MPPNLFAFFAKMLVCTGSLVDFFAIYLGTSMPMQLQWGKTLTVSRLAIALGICSGLTDMLAVNFFYGPEIIANLPCRPSTIVYEPIPDEENQRTVILTPPSWKAYIFQGLYIPFSTAKSFLDHTYFMASLFSWISEWGMLGEESLPAITTSLAPLLPWQMTIIGLTYLLGVLPLYASAEIQGTANQIIGSKERLSPFRNLSLFKFLALEISPYMTPLAKNLPQLAFFSPRLLWALMKSFGGICLVAAYGILWARNVMTSIQMVKNFDVEKAKEHFGLPGNPEIPVSRLLRFFWSIAQNTERSLPITQFAINAFNAVSLSTRAFITVGSVAIAYLPVYLLTLVGTGAGKKENNSDPNSSSSSCFFSHCFFPQITPLTTPSSGSPADQNANLLVASRTSPKDYGPEATPP